MSGDARVRFLPSGQELRVSPGTFLTTAAMWAGISILHDCDGQGVCGTCRVKIEEGASALAPPDRRERIQLGARTEDGWRLCCLVVVENDCVVRVPVGNFAYPPDQQRG